VASIISTPFELVKTQLQLQHRNINHNHHHDQHHHQIVHNSSNNNGSKSMKRGTISMVRYIIETRSVTGLYTGEV